MRKRHDQDPLYELSSMLLNIIRPSDHFPSRSITPVGFAAMMVGISTAMMICGSVTFCIGFFLMPWVLGLVMVAYVVGIVSGVSMMWRSAFSGCSISAVDSIPEESSAWKLL